MCLVSVVRSCEFHRKGCCTLQIFWCISLLMKKKYSQIQYIQIDIFHLQYLCVTEYLRIFVLHVPLLFFTLLKFTTLCEMPGIVRHFIVFFVYSKVNCFGADNRSVICRNNFGQVKPFSFSLLQRQFRVYWIKIWYVFCSILV